VVVVEKERVVAVVADRAMGRIEVHARRLVAQQDEQRGNRIASLSLPEYGRFVGGSIKLWRTASA